MQNIYFKDSDSAGNTYTKELLDTTIIIDKNEDPIIKENVPSKITDVEEDEISTAATIDTTAATIDSNEENPNIQELSKEIIEIQKDENLSKELKEAKTTMQNDDENILGEFLKTVKKEDNLEASDQSIKTNIGKKFTFKMDLSIKSYEIFNTSIWIF